MGGDIIRHAGVPWELDGGIHAEGPRVVGLERLHHCHIGFIDVVFPAPVAPPFDCLSGVGQQ